jgi:pyruvate/2-oxoglutarate dehydrogenase complex dihydrolipoamide acyltransferase (E2) component
MYVWQVTVEIRAPDAGVITALCAKEGDTVLVGAGLHTLALNTASGQHS